MKISDLEVHELWFDEELFEQIQMWLKEESRRF